MKETKNKYLFFDIECSNCFNGKGKICEFGYVLTDTNFNIIKAREIPMSPGRHEKFDKGVYKRDPDFEWAYDYNYYYDCKEFPYYYEKIKQLMEDPETIVFGYAIDNDIRYLEYSCERYNLDLIKFDSYDIQIIMRNFLTNERRRRGLLGAFKQLCDNNELIRLQAHLSRDDAIMTMRVMQEICKKLDLPVDNVLTLCPKSKFISDEAFIKYKENKGKPRLHQRGKTLKECQIMWGDLYRSNLNLLSEESSIGKIITISSEIKTDLNICTKVCNKIKENSLVAYDGLKGSDYLVCLNESDMDRLNGIFKEPYSGKMITADEFINKMFTKM